MKTLNVNTIEKDTNLIREAIDLFREKTQGFPDFIISEFETGKKWICRCIGNGNPYDLWITKLGTKGETSKTFKRIYVK